MNRLLKSLFALLIATTVIIPGLSMGVPDTHAQTEPMTMASCRTNQQNIRTGDLDQRATFEIDLHCTALVNNYLVPTRYESCGLNEYDRIRRANGSVTVADMGNIETLCRTGQTSASSGSAGSSDTPATTGNAAPADTNSSANSTTTGPRSGALAPLVFTATPGSAFVGSQVGLTTEPLKDYYVNPLLLVNDRQTAFRVLINFFLGLVGALAILFIVFNGFRYAASRGEDAQISQAKKGILYSVIGLIIILAAYTIVATILNFGAQPTPGNINAGIGITF